VLAQVFERAAPFAYNNHGLADRRLVFVRGSGRNPGDWLSPLRVLECEIHLSGVQRVHPVPVGLGEPSIWKPNERAYLSTSLDRAQQLNVGSFVGESGPIRTESNEKLEPGHVESCWM